MPQPHRSPIDEESRGHESTPDLSQAGDSDENEESQPETESAESDEHGEPTSAIRAYAQIAELEKQITLLKEENESLRAD
jgi:hypothetical protein